MSAPAKPDPLTRRRDELAAQVAELQYDLGGLAYEMAIRDHFRLDVLLKRAAELQQADAELGELDRLRARSARRRRAPARPATRRTRAAPPSGGNAAGRCWSPRTARALDRRQNTAVDAPLELRQLRYFVAVAEELHFGRAAERLHMSQSPLSRAIRELERELGLVLFLRTTRHVELTPAGAALLERARRALAEVDLAVEDARRAARAGERAR